MANLIQSKGVHNNLAGFEERLTGYCATITSDHAYIHGAISFTVPFSSAALAAAGEYKIGITTPSVASGKFIHWRPTFISSSANIAQMKFYEGSVYTGGTSIQPFNRNRSRPDMYGDMQANLGVTAALTGVLAVTTKAGGNFANQPAGTKVTVVSSNNVADKIPTATIYGTITGATTTVTSEVIQLDGTTAVDSVITTWQNILGIELSAACTGTVTLKDGAAATIITIAPAALSAGIEIPTVTNAREQSITAVASGTSTKVVGAMGFGVTGAAISSAIALNGASAVTFPGAFFSTISKVFIGAAESARNISVTIPEKNLSVFTVGGGGGQNNRTGGAGASDMELILAPATNYVIVIKNIGATDATDINGEIMYYEESGY